MSNMNERLHLVFYLANILLSNLSILSVPDEGYSRNAKFDIYVFITKFDC
jgi:hypothetical protein